LKRRKRPAVYNVELSKIMGRRQFCRLLIRDGKITTLNI
jgi:hypothetical protein